MVTVPIKVCHIMFFGFTIPFQFYRCIDVRIKMSPRAHNMYLHGCIFQSIPTNGLDEWFPLQQRTSKSKVSGEILLKLIVNSVDVSSCILVFIFHLQSLIIVSFFFDTAIGAIIEVVLGETKSYNLIVSHRREFKKKEASCSHYTNNSSPFYWHTKESDNIREPSTCGASDCPGNQR